MEFKRRLAIVACEPGVSVAKLALRHRINANLVFKWRRQLRAGMFGGDADGEVAVERDAKTNPVSVVPAKAPAFQLLPVVESVTVMPGSVAAVPQASAGIEVVFACATVRIRGAAEPTTLRVVLDCLARRR